MGYDPKSDPSFGGNPYSAPHSPDSTPEPASAYVGGSPIGMDHSGSALGLGIAGLSLGVGGIPFTLCCGCFGLVVPVVGATLSIIGLVLCYSDTRRLRAGLIPSYQDRPIRTAFSLSLAGLVICGLEIVAAVGFFAFFMAMSAAESM